MNKQHWNTVTLNCTLPDDLWQGWVHHSYERVVAGLPKSRRPMPPHAMQQIRVLLHDASPLDRPPW